MQPNKPYLWLDSAATPPTLLIYVPQSSVQKFSISQNGTTDVILTCSPDPRGVLSSGVPLNYTTLPATTTSVKVILKDGVSILGSCKLRKVTQPPPPSTLKPLVWVGASRVHYKVLPGDILSSPPPPNNPSILNYLDTITCPNTNDNNPPNNTDSDNWAPSFTTFDPAVVAQVILKVNNAAGNEVGETSSNTDDADGSGGNDLLDDFFD